MNTVYSHWLRYPFLFRWFRIARFRFSCMSSAAKHRFFQRYPYTVLPFLSAFAQQQRELRRVNDAFSAHCSPSAQARSSSSLAPALKRLPSSQIAPLVSCSMFLPLLPMPLPPEVQNGIMVLPLKS